MFWKKYRGKIALALGMALAVMPMLFLLIQLYIENRTEALICIGLIPWAFCMAGLITWGLVHWDE